MKESSPVIVHIDWLSRYYPKVDDSLFSWLPRSNGLKSHIAVQTDPSPIPSSVVNDTTPTGLDPDITSDLKLNDLTNFDSGSASSPTDPSGLPKPSAISKDFSPIAKDPVKDSLDRRKVKPLVKPWTPQQLPTNIPLRRSTRDHVAPKRLDL